MHLPLNKNTVIKCDNCNVDEPSVSTKQLRHLELIQFINKKTQIIYIFTTSTSTLAHTFPLLNMTLTNNPYINKKYRKSKQNKNLFDR